MQRYCNINGHHIVLKYIDADTNELLFEIKDKNWMEIGQFMTDTYVSQLLNNHFDEEDLPENVVVLASAELEAR